ncbi:MAG TPA: hypothetical protein VEY91_02685 [Candidatus Limnocylindria bacterium]|nr:hypothetical protein [Candidatus Limnocylindria bacterium]
MMVTPRLFRTTPKTRPRRRTAGAQRAEGVGVSAWQTLMLVRQGKDRATLAMRTVAKFGSSSTTGVDSNPHEHWLNHVSGFDPARTVAMLGGMVWVISPFAVVGFGRRAHAHPAARALDAGSAQASRAWALRVIPA